MATLLGIWNAALVEVGDATLASVTENLKSRRTISAVWAQVIGDCLEAGLWNFAKRTVQLDSDTGITPNFGEGEVFAKPTDWVRTMKVSDDDRFVTPYLNYVDEKDYWIADATPLYFQYVSNDSGYGEDLASWPRSFTRYVELELALRVCPSLTQNEALTATIEARRNKAKRDAQTKDAVNEPTQFPPSGSWTGARGGFWSRRDRGSRGSLIG